MLEHAKIDQQRPLYMIRIEASKSYFQSWQYKQGDHNFFGRLVLSVSKQNNRKAHIIYSIQSLFFVFSGMLYWWLSRFEATHGYAISRYRSCDKSVFSDHHHQPDGIKFRTPVSPPRLCYTSCSGNSIHNYRIDERHSYSYDRQESPTSNTNVLPDCTFVCIWRYLWSGIMCAAVFVGGRETRQHLCTMHDSAESSHCLWRLRCNRHSLAESRTILGSGTCTLITQYI